MTTAPSRSDRAGGARPHPATGLRVDGLTVTYGRTPALTDVGLHAVPGTVHLVVGSSGSGKTTLLRALCGLLPATAKVQGRSLDLTVPRDDEPLTHDLLTATERTWTAVRGRHIGVVFQDPALALTPLRRVASLVCETLDRPDSRDRRGAGARRDTVHRVLRDAGFPDPDQVAPRRCFELSGGMAQRLGVGLAVAARPGLLLADEPSTALDALARAALMDTLRRYADAGAAVVLVTHDLTMARSVADTVTVLDRGAVVEAGSAEVLLTAPAAPATRALVDAVRLPVLRRPTRPEPTTGTLALEVSGLRKAYGRHAPVLQGLDMTVGPGEVVGLAGRSGAGKTTLLRCVVGLERPDGGDVRVAGRTAAQSGWKPLRRQVQLVPQDPRASLNPWRTAAELVRDPLDAHRVGTRAERRRRAEDLLGQVGLGGSGGRRPGQLSTGQCQRLAIARALAVEPDLVVADEPVTALDAPLRAEILRLLSEVTAASGAALLVVAHDLDVLVSLCDRVLVMDAGRVVEDLRARGLGRDARHPLTRSLVHASGGAVKGYLP